MLKQIIKQNRLIFLLLAAAVILVYANSLANDFVSDDVMGILKNEKIGAFEWNLNFPQNWSWAATYHLFGKNPLPFRAENILFHLGNVWLIFILLFLLTQKKTVALLTALIFAVHPILTESVTWLSGGIYAKYSFFVLLALLFYLSLNHPYPYSRELEQGLKLEPGLKIDIPLAKEKIKTNKSKTNPKKLLLISASVASFIIALSFSEKAIIFPGVIFIYEIAFGSLKKHWLKLVPYFLISSAWFGLNFINISLRAQSLQADFYQSTSAVNPLLQIPVALTKYLELIFWPEKLSLYQTEMFFTPLSFWLRAGLTIIFIITLIIMLIRIALKKSKAIERQIFFWLSFFVIALLPTLLAFGLAWIVAERYVYLGTLGIIVVVIILWQRLNEKIYQTKKMYWLVGILVILILGARTLYRNRDWHNQDTLWLATVKVAPSGHVIHNNLGDMYGRWHQYDKSINEYKTAIAIQPNYADAMHNLANTYLEIGQVEQAIYWYQQALKNGPHLWQSAQNLGLIYYQLNDFERAEQYLIQAVSINPNNPNLQQNLQVIQSLKH